jgi:hypothetical protein
MLKPYWLILVVSIIFFVTFIICLILAESFNGYYFNKVYEDFNSGKSSSFPPESGYSNEIDVVYYQIDKFSLTNNLILIGSSTTRDSVIPNQEKVLNGWDIHNLAIGGGTTIQGYKLMWNYINTYANHRPNNTDVVVIHISYASFLKQSPDDNRIKQWIEAFGTYVVDDDLKVHGSMSNVVKKWELCKSKISTAFLIITGVDRFSVGKSAYLKIEATAADFLSLFNKKNDSANPADKSSSDHKGYQIYWTKYSESITYPNSETDELKKILIEMKSQTNVVVINMDVPSWQKAISKEKEYENWTKSDLIPFLRENNITWIDFSDAIPDEEYANSAHMNKMGRERYTHLFNEKFARILDIYNQNKTQNFQN